MLGQIIEHTLKPATREYKCRACENDAYYQHPQLCRSCFKRVRDRFLTRHGCLVCGNHIAYHNTDDDDYELQDHVCPSCDEKLVDLEGKLIYLLVKYKTPLRLTSDDDYDNFLDDLVLYIMDNLNPLYKDPTMYIIISMWLGKIITKFSKHIYSNPPKVLELSRINWDSPENNHPIFVDGEPAYKE